MSHMWDILHATRLHVSNFCAQVIVKVCANILSNWKSSNMYELELQILTSIMLYLSKRFVYCKKVKILLFRISKITSNISQGFLNLKHDIITNGMKKIWS